MKYYVPALPSLILKTSVSSIGIGSGILISLEKEVWGKRGEESQALQEKEERGSQTRLKEMKCRPMILRELSQLVTCLLYRSVEMGYCRLILIIISITKVSSNWLLLQSTKPNKFIVPILSELFPRLGKCFNKIQILEYLTPTSTY